MYLKERFKKRTQHRFFKSKNNINKKPFGIHFKEILFLIFLDGLW